MSETSEAPDRQERGEPSSPAARIPPPTVGKRSLFSIVWLIPIVAAGIGVWLVYQTLIEQGPTITITFTSAESLVGGKTKIRYKAVEVGEVDSISLASDLSHVEVKATFVPGAKPYLTQDAKFWVVRPRITLGGVSGLGTLLSGSYIGVQPGTAGQFTSSFEGLEVPPVIHTGTAGSKFVLEAKTLGSVGVGAPIYFKEVKVGEVVGYELAQGNRSVLIHAFVDSPHHKIVRQNSRFWNASGIDVTLGADGLQVRAESLVALATGGIAFETPVKPGPPVPPGFVFTLYESFEQTEEQTLDSAVKYVLYFTGSVRGLKVGAPVEFRGIKIGEVADVKLQVDSEDSDLTIPVIIAINRDQLVAGGGDQPGEVSKLMEALVSRGLRAKLEMGSLLTGSLYVGMDLHPDAPINHGGSGAAPYPELPTIPSELTEIEQGATKILAKLKNLPIEELFKEVQTAVRDLNQLVTHVDGELKPMTANLTKAAAAIRSTMVKAQKTLSNLEGMTAEDSPTRYDLDSLLRELSTAARSIRVLASYLERNPDALIYGKGGRRP